MPKNPYKYWTREQLFYQLSKQAIDFDIDLKLVDKICYSKEWNPIEDFNGCNCVQDELHPFLPCFIHDFFVSIGGAGVENNKLFRTNLLKAGFSKSKAQTYYIGIQLGWFFYYKWTK